MWFKLLSHIPAMSQNLSGIAFPFTVLGIVALLSLDLSGSYQLFKFLGTTNNSGGYILAKVEAFHHHKYILQLHLGRVERGNNKFPHRLCSSNYLGTLVIVVDTSFPPLSGGSVRYQSG